MDSTNKRKYLAEFEAPPKKQVTDEKLLLKKLAEKQMKKNVTIKEHLSQEKLFTKTAEILPITSLHAGQSTVQEFKDVDESITEIESMKSAGLSNEEVLMYLDYQRGLDVVLEKHKLLDKSILLQKIQSIENRLGNYPKDSIIHRGVTKDISSNLKLPMDEIKQLANNLSTYHGNLSASDITKIRRKARKLQNRIEEKNDKKDIQDSGCSNNSKWDVKSEEKVVQSIEVVERKTYICKPQKYYTIKEGVIVNMDNVKNFQIAETRLSVDDIRNLPKFQNYSLGNPSKILYLKNLPNLELYDLKLIFKEHNTKNELEFRIMTGRMKGQAFVTFQDEISATSALNDLNGTIINDKPMIIQFGKNG